MVQPCLCSRECRGIKSDQDAVFAVHAANTARLSGETEPRSACCRAGSLCAHTNYWHSGLVWPGMVLTVA